MSTSPPLVVDLDGTLLRTDCLMEGLCAALFRNPLGVLAAAPSLLRGPAPFKRRIVALANLDVQTLPANAPMTAYAEAEADKGRRVHLVTASDQHVADDIAARFSFFDAATGSDGVHNLKGKNKAAYCAKTYPDGFVYAGDSRADLSVWDKARGAVLVDAPKDVRRQVSHDGPPVEASFTTRPSAFKAWRKALRLHQWAKNTLVFAPLLLAHAYMDLSLVLTVFAGFILMGITASGTYIINDLRDLADDRAHRSKHKRPFAAGDIPIVHGLVAAPVMIGAALLGATVLSPAFGATLAAYLVVTLCYSFGLKRKPLVDVFILAGLFTLRLVMGGALAGVPLSEWLLAFSMFFFLSLSVAKRHVEIVDRVRRGGGAIPGRGYVSSDAPLAMAFGVASATASLVILVIYLVEDAFGSPAYANPEWLWLAPAAIALWLSRVWFLAHREELDDDPVVFAVKDRLSLGLGAVVAAGFALSVAT